MSENRRNAGLPHGTVEAEAMDERKATMTAWTTFTSPLGDLLLVGEETEAGPTLTALSMPGARNAPAVLPTWRHDAAPFADGFPVAFTPAGTDFQQRVWNALEAIPYGTTTTYGALAARLGLPRERIQALGAAIGANPLLLVRPCHRVIGADGTMRGYAGGVDRKVWLLTHEGALQPALM
jgi:methylated-DNA-[protein]-cysteine S-methyltransferase